jgi:hypothetical protein
MYAEEGRLGMLRGILRRFDLYTLDRRGVRLCV